MPAMPKPPAHSFGQPLLIIAGLSLTLSACTASNPAANDPVLEPTQLPSGQSGEDPWQEPLEDARVGCLREFAALGQPQSEAAVRWEIVTIGDQTRDGLTFGVPAATAYDDLTALKNPVSGSPDCTLLVSFEPARTITRTITGEQTLVSSRWIETEPVRQAQLNNDEVENRYARAPDTAQPRFVRTGSPVIDLIGTAAIGLFGYAGKLLEAAKDNRQHEANYALDGGRERTPGVALASEPYDVPAQTITSERSGHYRLAVFDHRLQRGWQTERWRHETAEFLVAKTFDPNDIGALDQPLWLDAQQLALWETAPPELTLPDLDRMMERSRVLAAATTPDMVIEQWQRAKPVTAVINDGASLVRLDHRGGSQWGVFVGEESVLTTNSNLPVGGLIEVEFTAGANSYGVVRARDDRADLAIIHVPRSAAPVSLQTGQPLRDGLVALPNQRRAIQPRLRQISDKGTLQSFAWFTDDTATEHTGLPLITTDGMIGLLGAPQAAGYPIASAATIIDFLRAHVAEFKDADVTEFKDPDQDAAAAL